MSKELDAVRSTKTLIEAELSSINDSRTIIRDNMNLKVNEALSRVKPKKASKGRISVYDALMDLKRTIDKDPEFLVNCRIQKLESEKELLTLQEESLMAREADGGVR